MIRDGYMLPFHVEPPAYRRGNKNTAYANSVFVCKAVADLVGGGFVEEVTEQPFICGCIYGGVGWWGEQLVVSTAIISGEGDEAR